RDATIVPAVGCEEHDRHPAAPDLADDFVRSNANALKNRGHQRPRRRRGGRDHGEGPSSTNQLARANRARAPAPGSSMPPSRPTSWNTFPVKSGLAPSSMMNDRRTRSDVPFRMNTLWASRADLEWIVNAAPGLSFTSLPRILDSRMHTP